MQHRTPATVEHDGVILFHADTVEAPGRYAIDVWQPGAGHDNEPYAIVATVRNGHLHEAPALHGPSLLAYALVARIDDDPAERFRVAIRQAEQRGSRP